MKRVLVATLHTIALGLCAVNGCLVYDLMDYEPISKATITTTDVEALCAWLQSQGKYTEGPVVRPDWPEPAPGIPHAIP